MSDDKEVDAIRRYAKAMDNRGAAAIRLIDAASEYLEAVEHEKRMIAEEERARNDYEQNKL